MQISEFRYICYHYSNCLKLEHYITITYNEVNSVKPPMLPLTGPLIPIVDNDLQKTDIGDNDLQNKVYKQ